MTLLELLAFVFIAENDGARPLRTMVLGRQNDFGRPQTCRIDRNVPRGALGTPLTTLLRSNAAQTAPGAAHVFLAFIFNKW